MEGDRSQLTAIAATDDRSRLTIDCRKHVSCSKQRAVSGFPVQPFLCCGRGWLKRWKKPGEGMIGVSEKVVEGDAVECGCCSQVGFR